MYNKAYKSKPKTQTFKERYKKIVTNKLNTFDELKDKTTQLQ